MSALAVCYDKNSFSPFVQRRRTICAILVDGIMGNIHVKLFQIWASGLGDLEQKSSLARAVAAR